MARQSSKKESGMSGKRLVLLAAAVLASAALIPAAALGGAHTAARHTVTLKNIRFHPGTLTINRGDSVTWGWHDGETEHNVTFHGFHSRTQFRGSYTVRFTRKGTFNYHCTIHVSEGMKGKIIVR
jgi:plastocyanin